MSDGAVTAIIVGAVILVLVLVVLAVVLRNRAQRKRLQSRFGQEYGRTVESAESRRAAEQELVERERRHEELDIKPLDPRIRDEYAQQWTRLQEQFVDAPVAAVGEADRLVTIVMAERGYPTERYEERLSYLSVEHADTLDHYREARTVADRARDQQASTEELRQAMVHYRALFTDLLRAPSDTPGATDTPRAPDTTPERGTRPTDTARRSDV